MSELKKCPFCGGEAVIQKINDSTLSFAVCVDCRMRTPTLQDGKTAMRVWNSRKPMDNIVRKLEELPYKTNYGDYVKKGIVYKYLERNSVLNIVKQEINNGLE